jgi:multiple sugar transport system permease protein
MKNKLGVIMYIGLLAFIVIFYGAPLWWLVTSALKPGNEALTLPPSFFFQPIWDNFISAMNDFDLAKNMKNSMIISLGSTAVALLLGVPAAYAFSRYTFKGDKNLFFWILTTRMAPPLLGALPFYIIGRQMGFYDTQIFMIVIYQVFLLPWVIWLMRSFFQDIPRDLDESAMIDGCSRLGTLFRIILPLARTGIVATAIFTLIQAWNEFFLAFILTSIKAATLPMGMTRFLSMNGLLWGPMSAASVLIALPIVIFLIIMQKHLVRGLSLGAVK